MNDFASLFDALYERLVLRDFFAKIVPGLTLLAALGVAHWSASELIALLNRLSLGAWLALLGLAWITGFGIQSLGTSVQAYTTEIGNGSETENIRLNRRFYEAATPYDRQQYERFAVIKEASANQSLALLLCFAVLALDGNLTALHERYWSPTWLLSETIRLLPLTAAVLGGASALYRAYGTFRNRQRTYRQEVLAPGEVDRSTPAKTQSSPSPEEAES